MLVIIMVLTIILPHDHDNDDDHDLSESVIPYFQDDLWYKITAERIGNIGRLNVRKGKPVKDYININKGNTHT